MRAYLKHEASYIFRIKDLDLIGLATCFGLLRLPRMPELNGVSRDLWQDADIEVRFLLTPPSEASLTLARTKWNTYAYADMAREAKRLSELKKSSEVLVESRARQKERAEKQKANAPWSVKTTRKEEREKRKEKKKKRRQGRKERGGGSNASAQSARTQQVCPYYQCAAPPRPPA